MITWLCSLFPVPRHFPKDMMLAGQQGRSTSILSSSNEIRVGVSTFAAREYPHMFYYSRDDWRNFAGQQEGSCFHEVLYFQNQRNNRRRSRGYRRGGRGGGYGEYCGCSSPRDVPSTTPFPPPVYCSEVNISSTKGSSISLVGIKVRRIVGFGGGTGMVTVGGGG